MPTEPYQLHSHNVNPASLVELQVLSKIAAQLQASGDVKGSIPYLAKICQIVDNQQADSTRSLDLVRADAHYQLGGAYFRANQFQQCEASLMISVKLWENHQRRQPKQEKGEKSFFDRLSSSYDMLATSYESLGKQQLAEQMGKRKLKLSQRP
ncbi:hypothetical protein BX666DRAFT_2021848 [Dichotomocladium elegans]|nr:hypothetical protein BX666DRAFT_2021848 [Dichotomocladium elegans]